MLFTFKRDDEGRETIEAGGVTIARPTDGPDGFEWINSVPGVTARHVREAALKAYMAGFWTPLLPESPLNILPYVITVDVPVAETTSTILSVDTSEDQA